jgi:CO/xanthine dehydrogenase FAD-binding subunit
MVTFYRRLPRFDYVAPATMDEALSLLEQYKGRAKVIAGGTDTIPKLKRRQIALPEYIVDLKGIPDLDYIRYDESSGLSIGPLATLRALEKSSVIQDKFPVLFQAVASVGSVQVRNRGTLGGNISNAVPSADTAPALLTLDAKLRLKCRQGERTVGIEDFFAGPNQTVCTTEEVLYEIQVPNLPRGGRGVYLKLTPRKAMDLAVVGVAVMVVIENGICRDIRIALGAVAPTPVRVKRAEEVLRGKKPENDLIEKAARIAAEESRPIDDHRASADYRREMVAVMTRRAIRETTS